MSHNNLALELAKDGSSIDPVEGQVERVNVHAKGFDSASKGSASDEYGINVAGKGHGVPQVVGGVPMEEQELENRGPQGKKEWLAYIKTKQFWIVLLFGYVFALQYLRQLADRIPQSGPFFLHRGNEHFLFFARPGQRQYPGFSNILQLRWSEYRLDIGHHL
jgi:hypothetical protein